jgi:hypothetical protein
MRFLALSIALVAITATPALAETPLVISGSGRPRAPSQYLSVETARTLPSGENTLALGFGATGNVLALTYTRGIGWGELAVNGASGVPSFAAPSAALGYKWPIGWLGPWDSAVSIQAAYHPGGANTFGTLVELPLDAQFGPGVLTLQPRVVLPDLVNGWNGAIAAIMAGFAWPLGGGFSLFGEGTLGWRFGGAIAPDAKAGLRYSPTSALAIDLQAGYDPLGAGVSYTQPQNGLASATVRYGF